MSKLIWFVTAVLTWLFIPIAIVAVALFASYMYVRDCLTYEVDKRS